MEEAAAREVLEETGLEVEINGLVGLYSEAGKSSDCGRFSGVEKGGRLAPGSEALEVGFFAPDDLPPLAFPADSGILETWAKGPV